MQWPRRSGSIILKNRCQREAFMNSAPPSHPLPDPYAGGVQLPPARPRNDRTIWYVVGALLVLCVCCGLIALAAVAGMGLYTARAVTSGVQELTAPVDGYMKAMARRDAAG